MPTVDILSQDEIDALLGGMSHGDIATEMDEVVDEDDVRRYDFRGQDRIVRGRMPTLETINERFARNLRTSLFDLLRRSLEIVVGDVQLVKYADYVQGLFVPANVNTVRCRPLHGTALFTLDPKLVFGVVDSYFGGSGRFDARLDGRDFTATELRVAELVLERVFADLHEAWTPVLPLEFERIGIESNPHLGNVASSGEVMVVTVFHVEIDGGSGELHIAMPYSMIEPIREQLDAGMQGSARERDERWIQSLQHELETAPLELVATLADASISLGELLGLERGDVLPIEMPSTVVARVEEVPVLRGRFGMSKGNLALQVTDVVRHRRTAAPRSTGETEHE